MVGRREVPYREFKIIAATINQSPKASVCLDKTIKAVLSGSSLDDAIEKAREWVDARRVRQAAARDPERPNVGSVKEYSDFLLARRLADHQIKMLRINALGRRSSEQLANAAGWSDYRAANLHYGALAKEVGLWLNVTFRQYGNDKKEFFTSAIAQERSTPGGHEDSWGFDLHPEFLQALRQHGIV